MCRPRAFDERPYIGFKVLFGDWYKVIVFFDFAFSSGEGGTRSVTDEEII